MSKETKTTLLDTVLSIVIGGCLIVAVIGVVSALVRWIVGV